jgi:adenylate kinase family enzyme
MENNYSSLKEKRIKEKEKRQAIIQSFLQECKQKRFQQKEKDSQNRKEFVLNMKVNTNTFLKNIKIWREKESQHELESRKNAVKQIQKYTFQLLIDFISKHKDTAAINSQKRKENFERIKDNVKRLLAKY